MSKIIDSLSALVPDEAITQISSALGESNSSKTKTAVTSTIGSILGAVLQKGESPKLKSVLENAANINVPSDLTRLVTPSANEQTKEVGSHFITSLFGGDKLESLTKLIASSSGISQEGSGKLLSMLSPLVANFLGKKMTVGGLGLGGLLGLLSAEKSKILSMIPAGLGSILGVSSLADIGNNFADKSSNLVSNIKSEVKEETEKASAFCGSCLKWLIPLLLVGGVLFWLLSSGEKKSQTDAVVTQSATKLEAVATDAATDLKDSTLDVASRIREMISVVLPDGTQLQGYKGGIEDQMVTFLSSSDYQGLSSDQLKDKWFDFDNINFEFGSGSKLTADSQAQIQNIVAILKHFKDNKVKLGAYTDKKGDSAANLKISNERAQTIRNLLIEQGVPASQIVGAEGYGSEFAKAGADASDEDRAKDRKIAIRFEK